MLDDIHGGVAETQRRLRLQAWGIVKTLGNTKEDALNVRRLKHLNKPKYIHGPKMGAPMDKVRMDHAHIRDIGLFFTLVDSLSGWAGSNKGER